MSSGRTLRYSIHLDVRGRNRLRIELLAPRAAFDERDGGEWTLLLPVWTPGSYLIREYARHVEGFEAYDDATGRAIPWRKTRKNRWSLRPDPDVEAVRIRYLVYCHELSVRTADVDHERAYWNGACVLLWPAGNRRLPARVHVPDLPAGWTLSTGAARDGEDLVFENLDEAVDAPVLAGTPEILEFEALGVPHRFVLDGLGAARPREELVTDTIRILEEAARIFGGGLPYDRYEILSLFTDRGRGGLEHRTSCTLLAPRTTFARDADYRDFMGLVAHELFHAWNGTRMRPAALWEIDYERENYTRLLWVVEGFTAYYDDLLCLRAGVLSTTDYLEILGRRIGDLAEIPGRFLDPLAAASFDAWIKLYRPDANTHNATQSYYTSGSLAAFCLDLRIRDLTDGERGLDDAMARLWRGTWAAARGYEEDDVVACLSETAGQDLRPLVEELVHGPFDPEFEAFLEPFGLTLERQPNRRPYLGARIDENRMVVTSVVAGAPAERAGIHPGDEIVALDGLRVSRQCWRSVLDARFRPGKPLEVLVARRGRLHQLPVTPEPVAPPTVRLGVDPRGGDRAARLRAGLGLRP